MSQRWTNVNSFSHEFGFCARSAATLPNACKILPKSTHAFHSAHTRCGGLSFCCFTDQRTASLPAFHPAETFMTCLTQSGPCSFFFKYWKGRWKEHQHMQVQTDHLWGCVGGFYEIMPPCRLLTGSEFTNVQVFLTLQHLVTKRVKGSCSAFLSCLCMRL